MNKVAVNNADFPEDVQYVIICILLFEEFYQLRKVAMEFF